MFKGSREERKTLTILPSVCPSSDDALLRSNKIFLCDTKRLAGILEVFKGSREEGKIRTLIPFVLLETLADELLSLLLNLRVLVKFN